MPRILIVGAGPTGLMLAIELARRGVDFRVIDRNAERSRLSKAMVVQVRTLEIYDALQIAEQAIAAGTLLNAAEFYPDDGGPVAIGFGRLEGPYSCPLILEQSENERILEDKLLSLGGSVERRSELLSAEEIGGGREVRIRSAAGDEKVRFDLVVGCDGASSTVRDLGGFPFEGSTYQDEFILADAALEWPYTSDRLRLFISDAGLLLVFPMRGKRRYRLIGVRKGHRWTGDPTLDEFRAAASALVPVEMRITEPRWLSRYRVHCRGVPTYRRGDLFLAGDAAHVHSPAGGQGMNTGLQDAWNLGWKLVAWASGSTHDADAVLDSYDAERRPFGEFLLSRTDAMFRTMLDAGPTMRLVRKRVAPRVLRFESVQRRLAALLSQVGIRHGGGALVASRKSFRAATLSPGRPQVGERAPQAHYRDMYGRDRSIFSDLRDPRFHLYLLTGDHSEPPAAAEEIRRRYAGKADVHATPGAGAGSPVSLRERYALPGAAHLLVRPDGYIASVGSPSEMDDALKILSL